VVIAGVRQAQVAEDAADMFLDGTCADRHSMGDTGIGPPRPSMPTAPDYIRISPCVPDREKTQTQTSRPQWSSYAALRRRS
jgi:hypothetical protein